MHFPPIEPYDSGLLPVDGGNEIYWETSGNPDGIPVLYLHGGPGSGLGKGGYRSRCDPERHLIIGLDQRGCGRSRPLAIDALERLAENTTQALISDIETLRDHLGVQQWLVTGVSWGCTLAQAYAIAHPDRLTGLVLMAVTTTSRDEVDWITEGVGRIFPEAWDAFRLASGRRQGERLVEAYARRLAGADADDRAAAAEAWNAWEDIHISLAPGWQPRTGPVDLVRARNFATLVTHYWSRDGFLPGDQSIMNRIGRIADMPAVLIHGRRDVSGPAITPWLLHQQWPASELIIDESEGHGGEVMIEAMTEAIARLTTARS